MKPNEDGIIFFIEINSNSFFKDIKDLLNNYIKKNSEKIIVLKINNSGNENKMLSKEIENYSLINNIKVFIIDKIYAKIINKIFVELISLILKKKGNNKIIEKFNEYIEEKEIYNFNYALIGDKYSGKSEIYREYLNFNKYKQNLKLLELKKYKIELEIYDIDESNILEFLNKYKINGIIFIFSSNSLESFEKMKEFVNLIEKKYKDVYESIICINKRNINNDDNEIIPKEINDYFIERKKSTYELNIEDTIYKVFIHLTYQILLKEKNEKLILEFFNHYREYFPILEYEKKLNKYLNF